MVQFDLILSSYRDFVTRYLESIGKTSLPKGFLESLVYERTELVEFGVESELLEYINAIAVLLTGASDAAEMKARLFDELELRFEVEQREAYSIKGKGLVSWDVKSALKDSYYWSALETFWEKKSSLGSKVIRTIDNDTTDILSWCGDPSQKGAWKRRGLVMGHVQSGKTTNYSALIAKALDSGYRHIIILAGITNSLRRQTQERLDEVILGFSSETLYVPGTGNKIGVAFYRKTGRIPLSLTTESSDFNKNMHRSLVTHEDPERDIIWVVKKNVSVLKALNAWLTEKLGAGDKLKNPLLVIDDEADNASIDTSLSGGNTPSSINAQIRTLLKTSERYSYVGYTATPFANIFIDPDQTGDEILADELFPADFIYSLEPPDNYVGPHKIFNMDHELYEKCIVDLNETEEDPFYSGMIKHSDTIPPRHKSKLQVDELPQTLIDAIYLFIMFTSWRIATSRDDSHASMLINVSLFNAVQEQIWRHTKDIVGATSQAVRAKALHPEWARNNVLARMHEVFNYYDYDTESGMQFSDLLPHLEEAIDRIELVVVNMQGEELKYRKDDDGRGKFVIAIGGLALSRGLTLEGLAVSYIIRNVGAKDTLLQTARWFGYRPGYTTMCRVFMPQLLESKFIETADTVNELRDDLKRMVGLKLTPSEFGLRVRHSGHGLAVTASSKLGTAEKIRIEGDFARRHYQVAEIWNRQNENICNAQAVYDFLPEALQSLTNQQPERNSDNNALVFRTTAIDAVVKLLNDWASPQIELQLIAADEPAPGQPQGGNLLANYVNARRSEMKEWDVAIPFSNRSGADDDPKPIGVHSLFAEKNWFKDIKASQPLETDLVLRQRKTAMFATEKTEQSGYDTRRIVLSKNRQVGSNIIGDLTFGMTKDDIEFLKERDKEARKERKERGDTSISVSNELMDRLERPLLLIHPLQIKLSTDAEQHADEADEDALQDNVCVFTISVVFPGSNIVSQTREYQGNVVLRRMIDLMNEYSKSDEVLDD